MIIHVCAKVSIRGRTNFHITIHCTTAPQTPHIEILLVIYIFVVRHSRCGFKKALTITNWNYTHRHCDPCKRRGNLVLQKRYYKALVLVVVYCCSSNSFAFLKFLSAKSCLSFAFFTFLSADSFSPCFL